MGLREAYECEFDTKHLIDVVQTKPMPTWGYVEWLEERLQEFMESPANSPLAPCNTGSPKLPLERFEVYAALGCPIIEGEGVATQRYRDIVDDVYDLLERQLRAGA